MANKKNIEVVVDGRIIFNTVGVGKIVEGSRHWRCGVCGNYSIRDIISWRCLTIRCRARVIKVNEDCHEFYDVFVENNKKSNYIKKGK
tara:strand:+ start:2389 stop:2652 length:264 start_codon:yes stop_codon:yes gene_type:complete